MHVAIVSLFCAVIDASKIDVILSTILSCVLCPWILSLVSSNMPLPSFDLLMKSNDLPMSLKFRRALEDDAFDQYIVEKGSDIFISVWNLHRSPDLWPEADTFNPDRCEQSSMGEREWLDD